MNSYLQNRLRYNTEIALQSYILIFAHAHFVIQVLYSKALICKTAFLIAEKARHGTSSTCSKPSPRFAQYSGTSNKLDGVHSKNTTTKTRTRTIMHLCTGQNCTANSLWSECSIETLLPMVYALTAGFENNLNGLVKERVDIPALLHHRSFHLGSRTHLCYFLTTFSISII